MKFLSKLLNNVAVTTKGKLKNIASFYVGYLVYFTVALAVVHVMEPLQYPAWTPFSISADKDLISRFTISNILGALIFAPLFEELVYRYAPIKIAKDLGGALIIPVILISSALFGWGHGNGIISVIFQGMLGFFASVLYIKNGHSYWSAVFLHFLWNLTCFLLF